MCIVCFVFLSLVWGVVTSRVVVAGHCFACECV